MQLLKYWPYGLAALAILVLSSFISYCLGVSYGRELEQAEQAIVGAKEAVKSTSQKEKVKNAVRKLSDPAIDRALTSGGWMRPNTDN